MLKVFTAFSGYDSQLMALDRLGIDYDCIGWSEIDKYAIKAHNVIYPQYAERNYGNICTIDWHGVPDFDLFTYSFPCTDISSAGRQKGLGKSSGTRSSLLWECERAIRIKRPKYLVMENVKALVSEKFKAHFLEWEQLVASLGYNNYSKVLNAKDYGVPQNRERIFMVSILNDVAQPFFFPKPFRLEKRLKDVLEDNVDSKYYLSDDAINGFIERNSRNRKRNNEFKFEPKLGDEIANSITTIPGGRECDNYIKVEQIGNLGQNGNFDNPQRGRVYSDVGLAPTLNSV